MTSKQPVKSVSTPTVKSQPGVYDFTWEDEKVNILLDRIRDHRGILTGELTIRSIAGGKPEHLHIARIGLLNTRDRQVLVGELTSRINSLPWSDAIEQCCALAVQLFREGEPLMEVGTMKVQTKTRYRLAPLLLEDEANLFYAPGGSCKSLTACTSAALVQCGRKHLNLSPIQGDVLYADYETSANEINKRIAAINHSLELETPVTIHYQRCEQPFADDIETIRRKVMECNATLIIVDSLGYALGGEPESAEVVMRYFMALRSLKITSLSLDHTSRKGEGPFGSVYKYNAARNVWELRKVEEPGEGIATVGLYHRKINSGRLLKPIGLKFTFNDADELIGIDRADVKDVPGLADGLSYKEQIAELLKHGPLKVKDIAEELGTTDNIVRTYLSRNKKLFTKLNKGLWGLLSYD